MFQQTAFRFGGHTFIHFDYLFESPQFRGRKKEKKKGIISFKKDKKWDAFGDLWIFFFLVILPS